jgi:septum formation protein
LTDPLILASSSPQRAAILEQIGIPFEAVPSGVEEIVAGDARDAARENARRKARAVAESHPGRRVLGADTVVVLGGDILGKPADAAEAESHLRRLSGRTHAVLGALCMVGGLGGEHEALASTDVSFRELSASDIAEYVATNEWADKAGGYAIQGRGAGLVRSVTGDYFTVVGLPVAVLLDLLKTA